MLPYLGLIRLSSATSPIVGGDDDDEAAEICHGILAERLTNPCFLELLWSYWHDEGGLVQTLERHHAGGSRTGPRAHRVGIRWPAWTSTRCARSATCSGAGSRTRSTGSPSPGGPTSTTTTTGWCCPPSRGRRCAAPTPGRGSSSRSTTCSRCAAEFFIRDDDTTVIADGFGVLNALKETHIS